MTTRAAPSTNEMTTTAFQAKNTAGGGTTLASALASATAPTTKRDSAATKKSETTKAATGVHCPTIELTLQDLRRKYSHQPTFLQAVEEMALSLRALFADERLGEFYQRAFRAMTEPERVLAFRVPWQDDSGRQRFNRGWRVEFSSVLGPYKGGLRFHPTVDEGVLKFLGFEQVFKNALTGLAMGGGKGGSDFDPKGKSDAEVRRFCESFMTELHRYLHPSTDVPAGDIGVGGREIEFLYGQYKRLTNRHGEGVLTGKSMLTGGSQIRPEATGYGLVYMADLVAKDQLKRREGLKGLRCAVSGSGNVAQYASEKLLQLGAKVLTVSDSSGVLVFENGMTQSDLEVIMECKNELRARLSTLSERFGSRARYLSGATPWSIKGVRYDVALPSATQNEIDQDGAESLAAGGVLAVLEGANLPSTMAAQKVYRDAGIVYAPGKAANAGGVGVSGLEMAQNAARLAWKRETVDAALKEMMADIYEQMKSAPSSSADNSSPEADDVTLEEGANRSGFVKVAEAMKELGWIY